MSKIQTKLSLKRSDPPHWTTFITPVLSLIVAVISLWTVKEVNRSNQLLQRPFLAFTFDQRIPGQYMRDETGMTKNVVAWGVGILKNNGNSPAYNVTFRVQSDDNTIKCLQPGPPIKIPAHDIYVMNPYTCMQDNFVLPSSADHSLTPVPARINYEDPFSNHYNDVNNIYVQMGGSQLIPNWFPVDKDSSTLLRKP